MGRGRGFGEGREKHAVIRRGISLALFEPVADGTRFKVVKQPLCLLIAPRIRAPPRDLPMPMTTPISLEQIAIASPCTASWDDMSGDEKRRLCAQCGLHVHNLSAMTREEAEALVGGAEGRLCVRLYRRADGTVLTRDCPVGLARARERLRRACSAAAALLGLASVGTWLARIPGVAEVRKTEPYVTLRNLVWGKPAAPAAPVMLGKMMMGDIAPWPPAPQGATPGGSAPGTGTLFSGRDR